MRRILHWRDASGKGLEHLALTAGGGRIEARSVVISSEHDRAWTYRIVCDEAWHALSLSLAEVDGGACLEIESNGHGAWTSKGQSVPELKGAIDLDLAITPFTNTLPIRRLHLDVGQTAEIVTAYVDFPGLTLLPDPQRYTRLSATTYHFEALDSDFEQDITVDAEGFVVDYPTLFARER
jgi:uncharacterized protein